MAVDYSALDKEFRASKTNIDKHLPRILEEIKKDQGDFMEECISVIEDMVDVAEKKKNKHEKLFVEICVESIKKNHKRYYRLLKCILQEKNVVKWKGHEEGMKQMVEILEQPIEWTPTKDSDEKEPSRTDIGRMVEDVVEKMLTACERDKIIKKMSSPFAHLLTRCIKSAAPMHLVVAKAIVEFYELGWKDITKQIPELLDAFGEWIEKADLLENDDNIRVAEMLSNWPVMNSVPAAGVPRLKSIMSFCLNQELEGEVRGLSAYAHLLRNIVFNFLLHNYGKKTLYKDLLPLVMELLASEIDELSEAAGNFLSTINQEGELLAPFGERIVDAFISGKEGAARLGMALKGIYQYNADSIESRLSEIMGMLEDMDSSNKTGLYMMLDDVAKKNPEVLLPYVDVMMADSEDQSLVTMSFMTLANIALTYPKPFSKHLNKCLEIWEAVPYTVSSSAKIVASIGQIDAKHAESCLKILFNKMKTIDPMWISLLMLEIKRIGQAYKEKLRPYRSTIEKHLKSQQMGLPDMAQSLIDFIDDISLHGLKEDVVEQRDDIDNLDNRVTNTEGDVKRIDETVAQHTEDINNVKNEVSEQGERLDELEEVVDETVLKVEEIDHKTITNAPKWSRDVSKLLNPEHEHDWRFLAVRLGYSGEDIRNWALSPDPTMAILAEWYTTHKSSDATYAVLNALEDMGRTDAAEIITQSLEEAELLVPTAPSDEHEKPPVVFLSYQWDHQPEVKAIKQHLEMAGFPCWMDIGQMGGGDQLFAKISQGMRSAKLVLCMVTEKYSNSENCNKEVNLANLLNKPIIPILIDQTAWPPAGAMSMLFAQLLYIQFYNTKEYVRGEKFWDDAKFSELLGQISYHANPDESMITEEYRDWIPQVEEAVVTKTVSGSSTAAPAQQANTAPESTDPPTVFISYQWGMQPEIKRLFSRLTSLGFHCWLDINQMGGGDPLFSKIDKGIRNAKVVISCVTPKYALSANCRREVSLSDALRKPIVPLLLEQMTWPPEGPMSMTFTELLYIDFTKESSRENFDDQKFDELLGKIVVHAQPTLEVNPMVASDSDSEPPNDDQASQIESRPSSAVESAPSPMSNEADTMDEPSTTPIEKKNEQPPQPPQPRESSQNENPKNSTPKKNKKSSTCIIL